MFVLFVVEKKNKLKTKKRKKERNNLHDWIQKKMMLDNYILSSNFAASRVFQHSAALSLK